MSSKLLFDVIGYDVVFYVVADYVDFFVAGVIDNPSGLVRLRRAHDDFDPGGRSA